jgi:hypothetical protein
VDVADGGPISEQKAMLRELINEKGGVAAYAQMKSAYQERTFDDRHNVAHLLGEALYDHGGIKNISVCDDDFDFGCYHGFLSEAIASEGKPVIAKLDGICATTSAPSTCQHGIGHGILEYHGHTKLIEALEACTLTNQPDPLAGCTGGVFMEYNVPLTSDEKGGFIMQARPLTEEGAYAPCTTLPQAFRTSCYRELPQWRGHVNGKENADITHAGELCADIPQTEERRACFIGLAGIIPSTSGYQANKTIELCNLMPTVETRSECLADSTWLFVISADDRDGARQVCNEALPEHQSRCAEQL